MAQQHLIFFSRALFVLSWPSPSHLPVWYHLYAWGVPLIVAGALWLVGKYGESELWCYIPDSDRFFMLTFLYLPLIIVCLGNFPFSPPLRPPPE
jgi:hypothetical protein